MKKRKLEINERGYWEGAEAIDHHYCDESVAKELLNFFQQKKATTVGDFGCGKGDYVQYFNINGLEARGFDGNPNTTDLADFPIKFGCSYGAARSLNEDLTEKYKDSYMTLDLSLPQRLERAFDWILSLETGEHIPKEFEKTFINNIHINNESGVVLSWAVKGQAGAGHVNCQDNNYIRDIFHSLGYKSNIIAEDIMRQSANASWFKNTIMIFEKQR